MTNFDIYRRPEEAQPAPEAPPAVGQLEDIGKGFVGGVARGTTGLLGLPADLPEYGARGLDWATRKVGGLLGQNIAPRENVQPTFGAANIQKNVEGVTGKFYEPQTTLGQYASTAGEFLPGMAVPGSGGVSTGKQVGAKTLNWLAPSVTSETAGQITKDTPLEPWARGIGGVGGGLVAGKVVTPMAPPPRAYQEAVDVLKNEGIPLTAGMRTGSRPLLWAESVAADMPGAASKARELYGKAKNAYDRAVTKKLYDRDELTARGVPPDVNLPDAQVAKAGPKSLSDEYTRITQNDLVANPKLLNRMQGAQNEYERLVLPSERASKVADIYNDIIDKLVAGKGRMAGDEYQSIRSQLSAASKAATNPKEAAALREMKQSLDEAFNTGISPRDAAALALNNQRWGNMKQTQDAVAAAASTGNLSPARMAQAVRAGRGGQYSAQGGNLDELTQAAAKVMKELPQSGTGPRTGMQQLFSVPSMVSAGGGGTLGTMVGGPIAGAIAAATPFAASRFVVSGPGQKYLGNQFLPQHGRDIVAQTLAQKAISLPADIDRSQRGQDEYEKKRLRITVHPRR